MKELRIHGRGGQGSVTAAELLAIAAFRDRKYSQAFPAFGAERRGAPVMAFLRIDDAPIRIKSQVYEPDYVMVQDASLIGVVDFMSGLKEGGILLINTPKSPEELGLDGNFTVRTINATAIAKEMIGRPIVNTTMMGAFAGVTGAVSLHAVIHAVKERFSGAAGENNVKAIKYAYDLKSREGSS
ncbi:MAG: pyruvate ferredoxin oxidoreductase, subunit gamma [Candidatus Syntrophoarchaeum caldarius]|uniref:pyruvate synthase n=1 Tax=Candidatus Syntropharchaeum caldarium TaxID=1838285 RepID=A0A1F2PAK5_9EURY|nr:MAG: pyruvate ferredoxin oxidoreductase, subunit gamma [Candidatus Syntrophoarchaeum caldarius]